MEKQHKMREQAAKSKRALAVVNLAARAEDVGLGSASSSGERGAPGLEEAVEGPIADAGGEGGMCMEASGEG
jgi:hypothetical protein